MNPSRMRDAQRLRKEADRFFAQADQANREGKSEIAERLQVRAAQLEQDAAVLQSVELRLKAERAKAQNRPKLSLVARNDRAKKQG
jgi:hypothetical protein